jgi:hypothetical protein
MLHPTSYDRYEKLKMVYGRLQCQNFNRHDLDDYIQIVNALPSCIEQDPVASPAQKLEAKRLYPDMDWQICRQIANQQKHFKRETRSGAEPQLVKSVAIKSGAPGMFHAASGTIWARGESIVIDLPDGRKRDAFSTVYRMFRFFEYIFEILPRSVAASATP